MHQVGVHHNFSSQQQTTDIFCGFSYQRVATIHGQSFNSFNKTPIHDGIPDRCVGFGPGRVRVKFGSNIEAAFIADAAPPTLLSLLKPRVCFFFAGFGSNTDSVFNRFFCLRLSGLVRFKSCRYGNFGVFKRFFCKIQFLLCCVYCIFSQLFSSRCLGFFVVGLGFFKFCFCCTNFFTRSNNSCGTGDVNQVVAFLNFFVDLLFCHAVSSGIKSSFELNFAFPGSGVQFLFKHRQTYRVGVGAIHVRSRQPHCTCLHRAVTLGDSFSRLLRTRHHLAWGLRTHTRNRTNTGAPQTTTGFGQRLHAFSRTVFRIFANGRNNTLAQLSYAFVVALKLFNNWRKALNLRHIVLCLCFFQLSLAQVQRVTHHFAGLNNQRRSGVAFKACAGQAQTFADTGQRSTFFVGVFECRQLVCWALGSLLAFGNFCCRQSLIGFFQTCCNFGVFFCTLFQLRSQLLDVGNF